MSDEATRRINAIVDLIEQHGSIDGDHHKQWVIDQTLRICLGTDEAYKLWVQLYEEPVIDEDDPDSDGVIYEWDAGIAP